MKQYIVIILLVSSTFLLAQTNLLPNGGLENWENSGNTLVDWLRINQPTQSTDSQEGIYSVLMDFQSPFRPGIRSKSNVTLTSGTNYIIRYKYKYLSPTFDGDNNELRLNIFLGDAGNSEASYSFLALDNDWNEIEQTFTPTTTGNYEFGIEIGGDPFRTLPRRGVLDDVRVFDSNALSTPQFTNPANEIKVLPTIVNDYMNLKTGTNIKIDVVKIFDLKGIQVYSSKIGDSKFNVSNLSNGVYLAHISSNKGLSIKKFIKH